MAQTNLYRKPIAEQKAFINSCIKKINEALEKGNLEKIEFTENEIAMISDIHADLFSLMGSMAQCGFKFQKDNFIFYNPKEGEYYYENEEGKYCKYNPNGNPKKTNKIADPQPDDSNFILSPIADDSEAHPLLCLGDLLDRSPESTAVLILLNTVDKFRVLQGDHEFDSEINTTYMKDQKEATEIVPPILADIKSHDKMPINTYSGKGNNVIEYSHVPTPKAAVVCMFDFLNDYFNGVLTIDGDDTYDKTKNEVFGALDKEFKKHKNLFNKLRLFLNNYEGEFVSNYEQDNFSYDKIVSEGNFTTEELLIIKGIIGDALTKSEIDEEGKNREGGFTGLNSRFDKLGLPSTRGDKANIFNFYDDFLGSKNPKNSSVCQCMFGHKNADKVTKYNKNVGIDVQRNEHQNGGTSKANTVVYNKENGMLKIYESKIKRNEDKELEGDVTKSKSITMELKNDEPKETIEKDKKKEKKTTNYDFSNDVKSVEIDNENNIKITVSTYDFYNNKEKKETIIMKSYDEVDCVGKNAIFAIFAGKNNLNIDNEKHKEIINNLVENLFKSDKKNDRRDFINLTLSNCDKVDTIKYVLSLKVVKDFVDKNKKIFINAALLNKNISVDHLKDIFFNGKEEEFNEYLKNNFLNKEEEVEKNKRAEDNEITEEDESSEDGEEESQEEETENKNKNKDKFFSTIIYTDNVELLKYLKNKNLLEVEDYKILLERAVIHNKMDIFKEISNNKDEYFGKNTFDEWYIINLLNIFIGNKSEESIDKILEICDNIDFTTFKDEYGTEINNFQKLFETAIKTKDKKTIDKVYDIFFNEKVSIDGKTSEKDKKEILNGYINTLLSEFNNNSLDINKKNNEGLLYLIKKIQGVENTKDIKFDKIEGDSLKELFKISAINGENILTFNITKHFTENSVKLDVSNINNYLTPALGTGDIDLIKKVFEICKNGINKKEFKKIINNQGDSYKWNVLLENSIKSSNKEAGKIIIDEISTIVDIKNDKVNCFMNGNLPRLLKLSIMCDNMGVFDSIINMYNNKAIVTQIEKKGPHKIPEKTESFNNNILKKNFDNLLNEAIKTGKAEIVNKVVKSYETVTGEELDGENLEKVEEFRKKAEKNIEENFLDFIKKNNKEGIIEHIHENRKLDLLGKLDFFLSSDKNYNNLDNETKNKLLEVINDDRYNYRYDYKDLYFKCFMNKLKNTEDDKKIEILINYKLLRAADEEKQKEEFKTIIDHFLENDKNNKRAKELFCYFIKKGDFSSSYSLNSYTLKYLNEKVNIFDNFINKENVDNSDETTELNDNKVSFGDIAKYLNRTRNNDENIGLINNIYFKLKDIFKEKDFTKATGNTYQGKYIDSDTKLPYKYTLRPSIIINYFSNIEDKNTKLPISIVKEINRKELKFYFSENMNLEDFQNKTYKVIDSVENNNYFDSNLSYLAYAPLQLQNENKDNIVFKYDANKSINDIKNESKKPENQGKTFICDNDSDNGRHCIQTVVCNGERIDFNTIGSSSEGVLHTINQYGANCILASKLFFTAVAQEYLAAKKGDFSEFVKDMRELSKFIGENGNKSKEKVNESNPDNPNYKKYHDLIEIAARANARLLKGAGRQFSGVDGKFKSLAGYFGINQDTIRPTDLSKKVEPAGRPVAKVNPAPTTQTAPEPAQKPVPEPEPEPESEPVKPTIPPVTTPPATPTDPKKPDLDPKKDSNPKKNPEDPTPEPKKALDIGSMPKYLSDRTVEEQEFSLNDFIGKVNKLHKDEKANEDEISFTTDTHGDLVSLMGAAAMCGVKFKENEFLYYDKVEGVYYEKVDGKYYKYDTMPYTGPQKEHGEPVNINMNNIIVVPIPDIKNARDLYHLGDVLDRGTESLTSLLLCEVCGSIKLAQGNHEFATNISRGNEGHEKEFGPIELALARMKLNGRIATGFYSGRGNNVMSYSHIPLTQKHVEGFFNFLNSTYVDLKYFDKSPSVIEALDKEFVNQTGNSNLRDKVKSFLISHKDNNFKAIEEVFTKEEMLIIKNVVGDALVKRKIKKDEDGKITLVGGGFNNIYSDFEELRSKEHGDDRNVDILNFEDTENEKDVVVVCNGAAGHQRSVSVRNSNGILYCDDTKSDGYNKGLTKVTITTLKKGTGEYKNSSCAIKRINNGIDSKFGDIEEETDLKLNKYKNSTIVDKDKTTGYDFTNDVKEIKIDGDNISITFRDGKGEKVISFKKDEYQNNLDCNGRSVIFAAVSCEDFVINNKDFVKNLFGKLKEDKDKVEALNYILTNYNDIELINEFLDLWLKKQKKSSAPITKPVGELDVKGHLIVSVLSNNKIPNDKISEILKKINNNKEYTKEEFDKNFANYKDKICSIIANPNNLGLYQYLSNNNFLDSSYYKKLLNFAIKFDNKAIYDELFKNDGKKYIDDFSEEEITKLLSIAIKSEKTEFIEKVFDLYKNVNGKNSKITEIQNDLLLDIAKSKKEVRDYLFNEIKIFETIDINTKDYEGNTLLHHFCLKSRDLETIEYLIKETRINNINDNNNLLFAVIKNNPNPKIINLLVKNGADINYRNSNCKDNIMKKLTNFFNYILVLNDSRLKGEEKEKNLASFLMEIVERNTEIDLSKNDKAAISAFFRNNNYFNFELFAKSLGSLCSNYNIELKDIVRDKFNFTGTNEEFGDFVKNGARSTEWKNVNGKKIIELFNICSHKIYELEEKRQKEEEEERRKKENQPPIPPETPEPTENTTTEQPNPKPKPEQETKPTQPQTEDNFEQTYKDLKQKQLKDEIKGKTVEEIKQQKQEEIKNIAKTDNVKTVLTERIEEHEKKVKLVNEVTKDEKSIKNGSVNVVKTIKEVKGEPGTKQTAVVVKTVKNAKAEDLFNDDSFKNVTLNKIEVDDKAYEGFGGKITYIYNNNGNNDEHNRIRLGFDESGFVMDQLKRMGFDKNDEYKEVYDIFKNGGGLVFNKQPNGIGKEETAEFMARFKLSPVDAYLWICQNKNISIKGENGSEINSDKIKEVLTAVTEARHAMASAIYYTESIKNKVEEQSDNEELNNYKELANFVKECSMKISKENSVNGFGLNVNGVEFKNPIFTVKCLNKILKIVDNKVNGKCKEGEEEVLEEIIDNFNSLKSNIEGNKNVILSNCLLKMYDFSLEKAGKKIDNIVKNNVTNLEF